MGLPAEVVIVVPGRVPIKKWRDIEEVVFTCCGAYNINITARQTTISIPKNKQKEVMKGLRVKKIWVDK